MIKASAGGGGRGIRAWCAIPRPCWTTSTPRVLEARNAFGSDELILEQALIDPRHVEINCSATATATWSTSANATARSSAAIRKS